QGHGSPLALRTSGQRHFCNPAHCAAQLLFNIHDFLYESVGQPAPLGYPMWRGALCPRRIERERTYSVPFDEEPSIIYCETDKLLGSYVFNSRLISCAMRGISAAMVVWISLSRIIPSTKPMSARSRSRCHLLLQSTWQPSYHDRECFSQFPESAKRASAPDQRCALMKLPAEIWSRRRGCIRSQIAMDRPAW